MNGGGTTTQGALQARFGSNVTVDTVTSLVMRLINLNLDIKSTEPNYSDTDGVYGGCEVNRTSL